MATPERAAATNEPGVAATRRIYLDRRNGWADGPVYRGAELGAGHSLKGPLVIEEETTTLFAGPDDVVSVDRTGNYLIELR